MKEGKEETDIPLSLTISLSPPGEGKKEEKRMTDAERSIKRSLERMKAEEVKTGRSPWLTLSLCLPEEKRRKKQKIDNGCCNKSKAKKLKILDEAPSLPQETREFLTSSLGMHELRLVIQKKLHASDVAVQQNRLSVPQESVRNLDFMSPAEWDEVAQRREDDAAGDDHNNHDNYNDNDGEKNKNKKNKPPILGKEVRVVAPNLNTYVLTLKRWELKTSYSYMFTKKWSLFVRENELKKDDTIQLWFFRTKGWKPCFALVKLPPP